MIPFRMAAIVYVRVYFRRGIMAEIVYGRIVSSFSIIALSNYVVVTMVVTMLLMLLLFLLLMFSCCSL